MRAAGGVRDRLGERDQFGQSQCPRPHLHVWLVTPWSRGALVRTRYTRVPLTAQRCQEMLSPLKPNLLASRSVDTF